MSKLNENNPAQPKVPNEPVIDAVTEPVPPFDHKAAIAAMIDGDLNAFNNMVRDSLKDKATIAVDKMEFDARNRMFNGAQPEAEEPASEETPEVEAAAEETPEVEEPKEEESNG